MKSISKHPFIQFVLPKNKCTVLGGRHSAIYHFYGATRDLCMNEDCEDCLEVRDMINELYEVDVRFRREWQKLAARYARVPQRVLLRAEYRRKRGKTF